MAWKNTVAHKLSIAYWAIAKEETHEVILADPAIENLTFYNPVISEDLRRSEMRIVVGEFLKHFAQLNIDKEPDGLDVDEAFSQLVDIFTLGKESISASGEVIDAIYQFVDET